MVLNGRLNMNYETFIGIIDWRVNNYNFDKKYVKICWSKKCICQFSNFLLYFQVTVKFKVSVSNVMRKNLILRNTLKIIY